MKIIKLHFRGKPRYFNVDNISAFYKYTSDLTYVFTVGDESAFHIDESP